MHIEQLYRTTFSTSLIPGVTTSLNKEDSLERLVECEDQIEDMAVIFKQTGGVIIKEFLPEKITQRFVLEHKDKTELDKMNLMLSSLFKEPNMEDILIHDESYSTESKTPEPF